jgi:hypothetical protein
MGRAGCGKSSPISLKFTEETGMKFRAVVLAKLILAFGCTSVAWGQAASRDVRGPIWIDVPASAGAMQSIQVKAPANGNVTIIVTGSVVYEHTLGTAGNYCLQLSQTSGNVGGCVPDAGSDSAVRNYIDSDYPTTVPGFGQSEQYSIVRTWAVTGGKTYTFYLNGYGTGFGGVWLFQPAMSAIYAPDALTP